MTENIGRRKADDLAREAAACEDRWVELCREMGVLRYVEFIDRARRCYGRLLLPFEVMYVWHRDRWLSENEGDQYGHWEPVQSQVVPRG